ncbi:hypothetical protein PRUPE_7G042000 [Prunus persica]|uniref:Uncharacterized protein n=1 Tax=Prunus persica TaxID=3760 RepID=A0A251N6J2_PRUPE|nr:hypothetical protein PRUPE_7G042000 [Prunus persica]
MINDFMNLPPSLCSILMNPMLSNLNSLLVLRCCLFPLIHPPPSVFSLYLSFLKVTIHSSLSYHFQQPPCREGSLNFCTILHTIMNLVYKLAAGWYEPHSSGRLGAAVMFVLSIIFGRSCLLLLLFFNFQS